MGRVINTTLGAALAIGSLSGCGESAVEKEAQVASFGWGIDAEVVEDQWVRHSDQISLPRGQVRDVYEREEFVGCEEVVTGWFGFGSDDPRCFTTFCSSGDDTHCEARYESRYSYESLEEVAVQDCPAPIKPLEYKPAKPVVDEECFADAQAHQRVNKVGRFVVWVRAENPSYNTDEPSDGPAYLSASEDVSRDEWQSINRQTEATAKIKNGKIVEIIFN